MSTIRVWCSKGEHLVFVTSPTEKGRAQAAVEIRDNGCYRCQRRARQLAEARKYNPVLGGD